MSFFDRLRALARKEETVSGAPVLHGPPPLLTQGIADRRNRKRKNARRGATALIIDDSPTVVAVLRKILRSAGYVTKDAGDAEQGLAIIAESKPDLIFLDIVLPGMNGFGALRAIRKDPSTQHIPVVMISGNEHATEQFYANKIGADDFMKKPFSRFEVFAHIELLLDADRMPRRKGAPAEVPPRVYRDLQPTTVQPQPHSQPTPAVPSLGTTGTRASPPTVLTRWPALDARTQLTAMGLSYFDQNQFIAAIRRSDQLAVAPFIPGRGDNLDALTDGKTPRAVAKEMGNPEIIQLLH